MTKKFCINLLNIYIYKDFDIILWVFAQLCERKFGGMQIKNKFLNHFRPFLTRTTQKERARRMWAYSTKR